MNTKSASQTHRTFKEYFEGADGHRTEPVERRIHVSRHCGNCDHYRVEDSDDWNVAEYGHCMNLTSGYEPDMWCSSHQTAAEYEAGVFRLERPVFAVVKGGAE